MENNAEGGREGNGTRNFMMANVAVDVLVGD